MHSSGAFVFIRIENKNALFDEEKNKKNELKIVFGNRDYKQAANNLKTSPS